MMWPIAPGTLTPVSGWPVPLNYELIWLFLPSAAYIKEYSISSVGMEGKKHRDEEE